MSADNGGIRSQRDGSDTARDMRAVLSAANSCASLTAATAGDTAVAARITVILYRSLIPREWL